MRVGGAIRGWCEGGRSHQGMVGGWEDPSGNGVEVGGSGDGMKVGGAIKGWCEGGRSHQGMV